MCCSPWGHNGEVTVVTGHYLVTEQKQQYILEYFVMKRFSSKHSWGRVCLSYLSIKNRI